MILRRTPAGFSHGEAPAGGAFLTLRLKAGWMLDASGQVVRSSPSGQAGRAPSPPAELPALPDGASFVAAMPQPQASVRAQKRRAKAAQAELARFVQLHLPKGAAPDVWLARAQAWEFVESAQMPPSAALP